MPDGAPQQHMLQLVQRRDIVVDGVRQVHSFNEGSIVLATHMGVLTIRGKGLHIQLLDLDQGHFSAQGDVDSLVYTHGSGPRDRERLWKKLWG